MGDDFSLAWSLLTHANESFLFRFQARLGCETGCHQYPHPPYAGRFLGVNNSTKIVSIHANANDFLLAHWRGDLP